MKSERNHQSVLIEWFHSHTRSILFLLAVLALAGVMAAWNLPVSLFPNLSFPRIAVTVDAGDQPAERMAIEVTRLVEEAVRAIPGIKTVRSTTSRGTADVFVDFEWGQDMTVALLEVESEVNKLLPALPAGTSFSVQRRDPTVFPVMAYSLTSDTRSLIELHDLAQFELRPLFSTVSGVSKVDVQGSGTEEYRVVADPGKLQAYGLVLSDLAKALSGANVLSAVGKLEDQNKLYLLVANAQLSDMAQIGATIIRSGTNGVVRIANIATVERTTALEWTRVTADGHSAILMQVYQQPNGNTVQIASDIKAKLAQVSPELLHGVRIGNWYDQSSLIVDSASSVRDAIWIGVLLAAGVLLIYLRNWKITLIAILTVPTVLSSTILMLFAFGMSFNIMTLGGMAAAVGLIIDDAIVMVEHIVRRLRGASGGETASLVASATAEFTNPLAGSSASTIIIFVPLAFLSGVTGAFFKALSLTMATSLIISFLTTWMAVPVLAAKLLGARDANQKEHGLFLDRAHRTYTTLMQKLLRRPTAALFIVVPLVACGYFAYQHAGSGFMPTMDEGGFIMDYVAKPGTSLVETDRLLRKLELMLTATPDVLTYSRRTGLQLNGGLTEPNTGDFFIRLKPQPRRNIEVVMDEVREKVQLNIPGLEIETMQLMEDVIGDLTAVPQPVEIKLFSDDQKLLQAVAPKVAEVISKVPGIVEVRNGIIFAGDGIDIHIDPVKAAREGISPEDASRALEDILSGVKATRIQKGPKFVQVRVWIPQAARKTTIDLDGIQLRASDGHVIPLKRIATFTSVTGQPEINRENLKRMVAVTARITGRDMGSAVADVKRALRKPGLIPVGVYQTFGGLYEQQLIAFKGMTIVLLAAVMLVFLLLLFMYESFRVAIALMVIPLLSLAVVFIGLWLTGTELNITSLMGMTMIVGIVTEVSIFFYSEVHDLPKSMPLDEKLIVAGKNRSRPIQMTTFAAILALLPLALNIGGGSSMQRPLAIAIISGLAGQIPLVLLLLPVLLKLVHPDCYAKTK